MAEMVGEFPTCTAPSCPARRLPDLHAAPGRPRLELPRAPPTVSGGPQAGAQPGRVGAGRGCSGAHRSHPSRAQEVRPLRGGGRRGGMGHVPGIEELDRPQHQEICDVSARPHRRPGLGAGTAPASPARPPSQRAPAVRLGQSVLPGVRPPSWASWATASTGQARSLLLALPRPALPAEALRRLAAQVAQTGERVPRPEGPRVQPSPGLPAPATPK